MLETMIEYYLPGLDASTMSDHEFVTKAAMLLKIRSDEKDSELNNLLQLFRR